MNKTIEAYPKAGKICKTEPIWQWDVGDKIHLNDIDLPPSYKAEFSNVSVRGTAKPQIQTTDTIEIPPEYQESGEPVYTWIVLVDENSRQTVLMIHTPVSPRAMPTCQPIAPSKQSEVDQCMAALNAGVAEVRDAARELETLSRVTSLDNTALAPGNAIEALGVPVYVQDVSQYAAYGITATGWYVFARIAAPAGEAVTAGTTITGAAGYIATVGGDHIDLAVRFDTTAQSVPVTIAWGNVTDRFVFKASDLAARNLDYRVTFYIYDISPYAVWSYALTADTAFQENKSYYTKDENDVYTLAQVQTKAYALTADTAFQEGKTYYTTDGDTYTAATVTVGDPVTLETYYEQSSVPVSAYYKDGYVLTTDTTFQDGTTYYTEEDGVFTEAAVTTGEAVTADTYYVPGKVRATGVFEAGTTYYTKDADVYTEATVTAGDAIPAYYNHSKLHFEGMTRNVVYQFGEMVDCPIEIALPEVANDGYGAWFEIMVRLNGSYSLTLLTPSEDVRLATNNFSSPSEGVCDMMFQYTTAGGVKLWRASNTKSNL